jgi:hypothetical protein
LTAAPWLPAAVSGGPLLGYVFAPASGGIAVVRGIPGAALLEGALDLPPVSDAAVSSAQRLALVVDAGGAVSLLRFSQAPAATALDVPASPALMALSPTGTAAALLYADGIRVVTGLTGNPEAGAPLALPDSGAVSAMAISDDGGVLLVSAGERLVRLAPGPAADLPVAEAISAIAFRAGSTDAVAAGGGALTLIKDAGGTPAYLILAQGDEALQGSQVAAFSTDGRRVLSAARDGSLVRISALSGGDPVTVSCHCKITALEPMDQEHVFRLNRAAGDNPLMLLEATDSPRAVFVAPGENQ